MKEVKAREHKDSHDPIGLGEAPDASPRIILQWTCPYCGRHNTTRAEGEAHCICGQTSNVKK